MKTYNFLDLMKIRQTMQQPTSAYMITKVALDMEQAYAENAATEEEIKLLQKK